MNKKIICILLTFFCLSIACATDNRSQSSDDILQMQGSIPMKLNILINNKDKLTATLFDNSSARALVNLLKDGDITIDMQDYGNFEKVGSLPQSLPRNDTRITTRPGDIILYQGDKITFYYDENTWDFTMLGHIDDKTQSELISVFGSGSISAVLSLSE